MTTSVRQPPELRMTVSADAPAEAAGTAVRACAVAAGVDPERATRFGVMIEELVHEAWRRETVDGNADVTITVGFDGEHVRASVCDERLPIRTAEVRRLRSQRLLTLGFADRLDISYGGAAGNTAACTIDVHHPARTDIEALERHDDAVAQAAPAAGPGEVDIRLMTPDEAFELVRCVYRCYGYTYPYASLYQAKSIRRALETGAMVSVVAVSPHGEIVGHVAYTFAHGGDRVPEAGKMVVDPRYRGHNLANRLAAFRLDVASARGIAGLWADCVTNHTASQRVAIEHGAVEIGLLIGATPTTVTMAGLPNTGDDARRSLMAVFTPTQAIPQRTISLPPHIARHVEIVAGRLHVERAIATTLTPPPRERTRVHTSTLPSMGRLEIAIAEPGRDLGTRVREMLDEYRSSDLGYVSVGLAASDPATAWAIVELEKIGFCWSVWVPEHLADDDGVQLQRVRSQVMDPSSVHCARSEGEAVRNFVLGEWNRIRLADRTPEVVT